MGLNVYQTFIACDDQKAVKESIGKYVSEFGARTTLWVNDDSPDPMLSDRQYRTFVLSAPKDGKIAIWEDGVWADRLLAKHLSKSLHAETYWVQMTSTTNTSAYCVYNEGKAVDWKLYETGDPLEHIHALAEKHELPHFLDTYENPYPQNDNEDDDTEEWLKKRESYDRASDTFAREQGYSGYIDMRYSSAPEQWNELEKLLKVYLKKLGIKEPESDEKTNLRPSLPTLPEGYTAFYCRVDRT